MKKHTLGILLVMVIIFTMTACVNNDAHTAISESVTIAPTAVATTATATEVEHECKVEWLNYCEDDSESPILEMTPEEISDYFAEMANISAAEDLCYHDMNKIGQNFYDIWRLNQSACNKEEFETQAITAFSNIFEQATKKQIPFDRFSSWENIPIADVLCKYFSGYFDVPDYARLLSIDELTEEEAISVAKVYFANPVFASETYFATHFLCKYSNTEAADMAWEHLISVSKSTDSKLSLGSTTYCTCLDIFSRYSELLCNTDKLTEIAENILQNSHYNFVSKYLYLCSDIESKSDLDKPICDMAYESLLKLAQNPSPEEYELIKQVIIKLYDKYDTELPVSDSEDWVLTSYLENWKEISNTRLPSYY